MSENMVRIGLESSVGSGETALTETLGPRLVVAGRQPVVITDGTCTQEDAEHLRRELVAGTEMLERHPEVDTPVRECGGDNPTSEGEKLPRKRGPAIAESDILVILAAWCNRSVAVSR